jgi:hypothetical protein
MTMPALAALALRFIASPLAKYLGIALVIAGVVFGIYHAGAVAERRKWEAAVTLQKLEAAGVKLKAEQAARTAEGRVFALGVRLEKERDDHAKQLESVQTDNRGRVADIERLLERARSRARGADGVPSAAAAAGGDPGGAALGEFLGAIGALAAGSEGLAREADDTALAGIVCHAYTVALPAALKP